MERARIVERFVASAEAFQADEKAMKRDIESIEPVTLKRKRSQIFQPWLPPAVFRFLFGVTWDTIYGVIVIFSTCLINWAHKQVTEKAELIIVLTHMDLMVALDCIFSISIRISECVTCLFGILFDNYSLSNFRLVFANGLGIMLDGYCCLPWLLFYGLDWPSQYYVLLNLLRLCRLVTPRRMALDLDVTQWIYNDLQKQNKGQLSREDFDREWKNADRLLEKKQRNLRRRKIQTQNLAL